MAAKVRIVTGWGQRETGFGAGLLMSDERGGQEGSRVERQGIGVSGESR